ncbi:MAG: acyltransferase [Cereibacter sphaeroides]|uniref:Acyltransferase n=1 Tax=Cereibacter sphaeroides TaxID=1063 RepID=A0A2W5UQG4_CERSP|nr:MAG: acyltransferase [Cereibacter sphaeroides]
MVVEHAVGPAEKLPPRRGRVLDLSYARPEQSWFRRTLIRLVERASGKSKLERIYANWLAQPRDPQEPIFSAAIRMLHITPVVVAGSLTGIPRSGPVLVLANHPFGIIDGLLVGHLVALVRPDMKLMVHSLLCQPEEARDVVLPVDFGETEAARRTSLETRRQAAEWLDAGHVLIVFPAGSASTADKPLAEHATDAAWHPFAVRLAARKGVRTVMMFVHGQNSRLFQIASHLSYPLRVALILRETAKRVGTRVRVAVGPALTVADLPVGQDRAGTAQAFREMCYGLAGADGPDPAQVFVWPRYIRW